MAQSPGEPQTLHEPLEVLKRLLTEEWAAKRVNKPEIQLRSKAGNVYVDQGDWVLLYLPSPLQRENKGNRHRTERQPASIDIRTQSRATAFMVRDEIVRILDRAYVRPDPDSEWDSVELQNEAYPNDYADYTQIVIDCELVRYLRPRALPRALGG